jgi:putative membrane protein
MTSKLDVGVTASTQPDRISTELSARRTGMSFQRTRMSADRTLMSVMRTSLSLIGFGFTIFQVFQKLHETTVLKSADAAGNFGKALVLLGLVMLGLGIGHHVKFMVELRALRAQMKHDGLVHGETAFPFSATLAVALLLFAIMVFSVGPFH